MAVGAPKARKNKAQGGRASEASSETLGSDGRNLEPCKGGTAFLYRPYRARILVPFYPGFRRCAPPPWALFFRAFSAGIKCLVDSSHRLFNPAALGPGLPCDFNGTKDSSQISNKDYFGPSTLAKSRESPRLRARSRNTFTLPG
jgi:hypothetical protein